MNIYKYHSDPTQLIGFDTYFDKVLKEESAELGEMVMLNPAIREYALDNGMLDDDMWTQYIPFVNDEHFTELKQGVLKMVNKQYDRLGTSVVEMMRVMQNATREDLVKAIEHYDWGDFSYGEYGLPSMPEAMANYLRLAYDESNTANDLAMFVESIYVVPVMENDKQTIVDGQWKFEVVDRNINMSYGYK